MKARTLFAAALVALAGCHGGDDFDDVGDPITVLLTNQSTSPIQYTFPSAGSYELRITGEINCQQSPAVINIGTSVSGSAAVSDGEEYSAYELANCVPVPFEQRVTYALSGAGPWQVAVHLYPAPVITGTTFKMSPQQATPGPGAGLTVRELQLSMRRAD